MSNPDIPSSDSDCPAAPIVMVAPDITDEQLNKIDFDVSGYGDYLRSKKMTEQQIGDLVVVLTTDRLGSASIVGRYNPINNVITVKINDVKKNTSSKANRRLRHKTQHAIDRDDIQGLSRLHERIYQIGGRLIAPSAVVSTLASIPSWISNISLILGRQRLMNDSLLDVARQLP